MILISTTTTLTCLFYFLAIMWQVPVLAFLGVFFMVLTGFLALCEHQAHLWQIRLDEMLEED